MAAWSGGGMHAPHIAVKRSTCSTLVKGMIPGTIGTAIPAARARSTKPQVVRVLEEELRDEEVRPRVHLGLQVAQVGARSRVSTCPSG